LVVIAIIALLMAILMPALQRIKKQAKTVACQSNLRQWALYFSLYTDDNNGHFHRGWNDGEYSQDSWMVVMRPYYPGNPDLCFCPTATKPHDEAADSTFAACRHKKSITDGLHCRNRFCYNMSRQMKLRSI
jgi:type II secretory pathway pseudopilin PulG